jgi:hypothetical protein
MRRFRSAPKRASATAAAETPLRPSRRVAETKARRSTTEWGGRDAGGIANYF